MHRLRIGFFTTIALAALSVGCAKKTASDDALANDIKGKLYSDQVTKPATIDVAVKNGIVTLSGDVPSSDVEFEAVKLANGTSGVTSVSDQLKVNGAAAANQPNQNQPSPYSSAPAPEGSPAPAAVPSQPAPPSASARAAAPHVPEQSTEVLTIPAGERVQVRTIDAINSAQNSAGQTFRASLDAPLVSHGRVVVPAGANASILLTSAKGAGRIKGNSEMEVRLASLEYRGHTYPVESSVVAEQGKARGKQTMVRTGIGAAAGAIIGALAGGGKGAAIGSAAGGGAGLGYDVLTHGQQVKIPSETVLNFRLEAPLLLQERR
jgi:hypothetical protein